MVVRGRPQDMGSRHKTEEVICVTVAQNFTNSDNLVRPGKADMFSGSQSHRGRSQKPFSLGRIRGGNEADEAD